MIFRLQGNQYSYALVELARVQADLAVLNEHNAARCASIGRREVGIESLIASADAMKG